MGLADKEPISSYRPGPRCQTCIAYLGMPKEDRVTLDRWLADRNYTDKAIVERLHAENYTTIKLSSLKRHRQGGCCGTD